MATERRGSAGEAGTRWGGYVRISEDEWIKDATTAEMRLSEKGITRQKEDITALAGRLDGAVAVLYSENDTSAYKKRRIQLPNGVACGESTVRSSGACSLTTKTGR